MVCQVGTPENLVDALRGQCVALKQQVHASEKSLLLRHSGSGCFDATQASPLLERIEEYNRQHGFREVGFLTRSRKQAAGLQSWQMLGMVPAAAKAPKNRSPVWISAQARAIFLPNSSLSPRVAPWHCLHLAGTICQTNNMVAEVTVRFVAPINACRGLILQWLRCTILSLRFVRTASFYFHQLTGRCSMLQVLLQPAVGVGPARMTSGNDAIMFCRQNRLTRDPLRQKH